jgi:hypothetical protein
LAHDRGDDARANGSANDRGRVMLTYTAKLSNLS